jgi:hypothetical protein
MGGLCLAIEPELDRLDQQDVSGGGSGHSYNRIRIPMEMTGWYLR